MSTLQAAKFSLNSFQDLYLLFPNLRYPSFSLIFPKTLIWIDIFQLEKANQQEGALEMGWNEMSLF